MVVLQKFLVLFREFLPLRKLRIDIVNEDQIQMVANCLDLFLVESGAIGAKLKEALQPVAKFLGVHRFQVIEKRKPVEQGWQGLLAPCPYRSNMRQQRGR